MTPGNVVTFYSYKGGVGRTLTLANVAVLLAKWGYDVLVVDWDLEAPGLSIYYQDWLTERRRGVIELIDAHANSQDLGWSECVSTVPIPLCCNRLKFISAGRSDDTYVSRVQELNWEYLYQRCGIGALIERWRQEWVRQFDFVLIDSRTGITDIGGICAVQLPDILVMFSTPNAQSLNGVTDFAERAIRQRGLLPLDRGQLRVLPVVTRLEMRLEYATAQLWLRRLEKALAPFYATWVHKTVAINQILNLTRVPYVPFWSFGEGLPALRPDSRGDPEDLCYWFETLAALIACNLAETDVLISAREAFIKKASSPRMPAARISDATLHGGSIVSGAATVLIGGRPAARLTDMHICPAVTGIVPHVGGPILGPGGASVLIEGQPAARVGDACLCVGAPDEVIAGSMTVLIG